MSECESNRIPVRSVFFLFYATSHHATLCELCNATSQVHLLLSADRFGVLLSNAKNRASTRCGKAQLWDMFELTIFPIFLLFFRFFPAHFWRRPTCTQYFPPHPTRLLCYLARTKWRDCNSFVVVHSRVRVVVVFSAAHSHLSTEREERWWYMKKFYFLTVQRAGASHWDVFLCSHLRPALLAQ